MIHKSLLDLLNTKKSLLAFSYGIDSTALFFLLEESKIDFDIAIVNYQIREEAQEEIEAAKELAQRFNKKIFIKKAPKFSSNFEKSARDFRYQFFEDLIKEKNYTALLTAHQLNDKLEWFLMQLSKGAGVCELKGISPIEERDNYTLIRPTLNLCKNELQEYLQQKKEKYFIDKTNADEKIKRNYFRKNFSDKFLEEFSDGVKRSFEYIENDCNYILKDYKPKQVQELYILQRKDLLVEIKEIELTVKKLGYILSKPQKDEVLKESEIVIGNKIAISKTEEKIFINPFFTPERMEKEFKERCRVLKIPQKARGYLYREKIDLSMI